MQCMLNIAFVFYVVIFVIFEERKKNGQSVVKITVKEERHEILRQASV